MPPIVATDVSAWLEDLLCTDLTFEVQSVFRGSFNLVCEGGRLLHISDHQKGIVPFGAAVDSDSLSGLLLMSRPEQRVAYSKEQNRLIWETGESISLEAAQIYSGTVSRKQRGAALVAESLERLRPIAEWIISDRRCGLDLTAMASELDRLRNFLWKPKAEDTAPVLDYWIGRGPGLTPSGDDILVGMLLVLWWTDCRQSLEAIKSYIDDCGTNRTTLVSCEYLRYALRGGFSQELVMLTDALEHGEGLNALLMRVLESGHTSGADTLIGVYLAFALVLDPLSNFDLLR